MQRTIDDALNEWKRQPIRKPIFLEGAPRTGKTYSALAFGNKAYAGQIVNIDCATSELAKRLFPQNQNIGGFLAVVEKVHGSRIDFEKTLVVIDNAQNYPSILREVTDLCQQRRNLNIILIGTLSQELLKKSPWIVSSYNLLRTYPLCFAEFLRARNREDLAQALEEMGGSSAEAQHPEIIKELESYSRVGGMPEVVQSWIDDGDIAKVRELQKAIIARIFDLKLPGSSDVKILKSVILGVAFNAGYQLDYQTISPNTAMSHVKHCLDNLELCGIVHRVNPSTPTSIPEINFKVKKFKTIFLDIGLLQVVFGMAGAVDGEESDSDTTQMFEAVLDDQFVGQELLCAQRESVKYWASSVKESSARVNFLIPINDNFINLGVPIVIKSLDMTAHDHSLDICLGSYPECSHAYVLSKDPVPESQSEKIREIPIYYAMSLGNGF